MFRPPRRRPPPHHRHPPVASGPPALATHHDPSLEPRAAAPSLCVPRHTPARPRAAQGHIMMGLEGQASTHHPSGPGWGTNPLHWIRRLTRHQKRELSVERLPATAFSGSPVRYQPTHRGAGASLSPPSMEGPHNPKRFRYHTYRARHPSHHKPTAEPYSQAGSRQQQRNQQNPKNQPKPTNPPRAGGGGGGGTTGPPVCTHRPSNRGRHGWHPLSRAGFFPPTHGERAGANPHPSLVLFPRIPT